MKFPNNYKKSKLCLQVICFLVLLSLFFSFFKEYNNTKINSLLASRNNLWVHYGQKSIKSKLCELEKSHLILYLSSLKNETDISKNKTLIENLQREIERYKAEQNFIQEKALDSDYEFEKRIKQDFILSILLLINQIILCILIFVLFPENTNILKLNNAD